MQKPIDIQSYVEVEGIVESKNKLKGYHVHVFQPEQTDEFDPQLYNDMIAQMVVHSDNNTYFINNRSEHYDESIGLIGLPDKSTNEGDMSQQF